METLLYLDSIMDLIKVISVCSTSCIYSPNLGLPSWETRFCKTPLEIELGVLVYNTLPWMITTNVYVCHAKNSI